jgi:hypothetical protein
MKILKTYPVGIIGKQYMRMNNSFLYIVVIEKLLIKCYVLRVGATPAGIVKINLNNLMYYIIYIYVEVLPL